MRIMKGYRGGFWPFIRRTTAAFGRLWVWLHAISARRYLSESRIVEDYVCES